MFATTESIKVFGVHVTSRFDATTDNSDLDSTKAIKSPRFTARVLPALSLYDV